MEKEIAKYHQYLKRRYPESSTSKHYVSDLGIFRQFVGVTPLREISLHTIDAFIQQQTHQKLKPKTINRRLAAISGFFEHLIAEAEDDHWRNPVRWKRHSIRTGHRLPRDVSDETVTTLFGVIDDERDRAIFTLMIKAGLRVGESVALNLENLEQPDQDGLARLKVRGKGSKERMVWLTVEAYQHVEQWLNIRPESESQALFLNQHRRRLSVAGVQYRLQQYCQQAGVQVSCHQLRHTFARRLAEQNMPIDSLAKLMGHNNLQTTQGYIDGADPIVRADFLTALRNLDRLTVSNNSVSATPVILASFPPVRPDERPDHEVILAKFRHLGIDLPGWLWPLVARHTLRRMPGWSTHQLEKRTRYQLTVLCSICRWLVTERDWSQLTTLQRVDLVAYVNARQEKGIKASSIGTELAVFRTFWRDLLEQDLVSNGAILQVKSAAPPSGQLPKYLTGDELQALLQVIQLETKPQQPQDQFNQTWFYLLAHGGLRISEALNLRLADCDFSHSRLRIRAGKGDRDRVIPMTPQLVTVLQAYLLTRETSPTDHLLVYEGGPVKTKLVSRRLRKFGQLANIAALTPHRLRHTLATLLINGGMPITSLQKFLGHQNINQTLRYARVYDETVRQQFMAAMIQIETILVSDWPTPAGISVETPVPLPELG